MMQRATVDIRYRLKGDWPGTPIREITILDVYEKTGSEIVAQATQELRQRHEGKKVFVVSTVVRDVELIGD